MIPPMRKEYIQQGLEATTSGDTLNYDGAYWIGKMRELMKQYGIEDNPEIDNFFEVFGVNPTPAATRHHSNHEWGLWEHLYYVTRTILELNVAYSLGFSNYSLFKIALCHDLEKFLKPAVPNYTKTGKLAKNPWKWEKIVPYMPHSVFGLLRAKNFFSLDEFEEHAILFHMGPFDYDVHFHGDKVTKMAWLLYVSDHFSSVFLERVSGNGADDEVSE